ncbi:MAG: AlwI family type II restriction endonuclease [Firmicutes bacterium HGW-Firmicutes-7]|nr:MAG: AlwI family type II restriction endonuclease [Firmicutes bacterium HGW-Firmicutes-7]
MLNKAWYIGNTTLRNPRRLKEGLNIYQQSDLHGNLTGKENETKLAILLHNSLTVYIKRLDDDQDADVSDMGRKWRAALMQLGFIKHRESDEPFKITANGQRLIKSNSLAQENECFLRSLLAQQVPSVIESFSSEQIFNPLRVVLQVLKKLEESGLEPVISIDEMATYVQRTGQQHIDETIKLIEDYRKNIGISENKEKYKNEIREAVSSYCVNQAASTLKDYADTNFRYLKLTGLFVENSRRLRIADHKKKLVDAILSTKFIPLSDEAYPSVFWEGSALPTDNSIIALEEIRQLQELLKSFDVDTSSDGVDVDSVIELSRLRLELEDELFRQYELMYAKRQFDEYKDIVAYMNALQNPRQKGSMIPGGEAPAYLEWIIWRAFLSINSLVNKPWEARRFRIDENFKPINTAPGGGPDIIFEFEDYVFIVEVTLTMSSRQEAAEGEPVRRHVASYVDHYERLGKIVYGIFIANQIDTNTAETFRIGSWYRNDESKMSLKIVPLTLEQFTLFYEKMFLSGKEVSPDRVYQLLIYCLAESNSEAPTWKRRIDLIAKR